MGETKKILGNNSVRGLLLLLIWTTMSIAQVTISPTSLFLDSKKRFETIIIQNSSAVAQEVQLTWKFGYPKADDQGTITMIYEDSLLASKYSSADWIRGFPKNFILEPGARQTIRVTVKAPKNLEDGTYWTRLFTTSGAVSSQVGSQESSGISAEINIKFNQITTVFFKKGSVSTGLELKNIEGTLQDQELIVLAHYNKSGNSPYLGTMSVNIFDEKGKLVKERFSFVSLYFDGTRRLNMDVADLKKGNYDVEVKFVSSRDDIPDSEIIPAGTVTGRSSFTKL